MKLSAARRASEQGSEQQTAGRSLSGWSGQEETEDWQLRTDFLGLEPDGRRLWIQRATQATKGTLRWRRKSLIGLSRM
jgi:hypothetical protein